MTKAATSILVLFFCLLILLGSASNGFGQFNYKLSVNFDFVPASNLQDRIPGLPESDLSKWEIFTGEGEFSFPLLATFEKRNGHPVPTRALINRLTYQAKATQITREENIYAADDEFFNSFNYSFLYLQKLSNAWYLNLIGGVGIAADELGDASKSDAKFQAGFYFDRHTRSGWTWGLGIIFSQFTGDNLVFPMVHLAKENSARTMKFELLIPKISFEYRLNELYVIGLRGELVGDLYTVTNREVTLYDTDGNVVKENVGVELAFSEFKFGPHVTLFPLATGVSTSVHAGVSFARRFELLAKGESETLRFPPGADGAGEKTDFDIKASVFFKGSLSFEF